MSVCAHSYKLDHPDSSGGGSDKNRLLSLQWQEQVACVGITYILGIKARDSMLSLMVEKPKTW